MSQLDQMVILVGPPKTGKTTYVRGLVIQHLVSNPTGIALVQDSNGDQFSDICATYNSVTEYRLAVANAARSNAPLARGAAFRGMESRAMTALAMEIGDHHNAALGVRVPIMLAFDESSMMESSGATWIDRSDLQLIATRRHKGIAPVFNCQRDGALTQAFFDMSTDCIVFSQNGSDGARSLEKKLGLPKGSLERLIGAPKFVYAHWKQGEGLV